MKPHSASLLAAGVLFCLSSATASALPSTPTVPESFTIHVVATTASPGALQDIAPGQGGLFGTDLYFLVSGSPDDFIYRVNPWGGTPQLFATVPGGNLTHLQFGFNGDLFAVAGQAYVPSTVYRITSSGVVSVFSTPPPTVPPGLTQASDGFAYSGGGSFGNRLFVSEFDNCLNNGNPINAIEANGTRSEFVRLTSAGCNRLTGLAFGLGGGFGSDLYGIYAYTGAIYRIDASKNVTPFPVSPQFGGETLAFGSPGNLFGDRLFVAKDYSDEIYAIAPDGTSSVFASGFQGFTAGGTTGLSFSQDKKMLFVTDDNAGIIYAITFPKLSCVGYDSPMNGGPVTVRGNRALPFKARLFDAAGSPVTGSVLEGVPPVLQVTFESTSGPATDVTSGAVPLGLGTAGNQFVFNEGVWQFNLSTKGFTAPGTYTVTMAPGNSYFVEPTCSASFVIR